MKRALFAIVLGAGMSLMGCAAGVEDPVPPAPPAEELRDPPQRTLSGELRAPQQQLLSVIQSNNSFNNVPAKQAPPLPIPVPELEER